MVLENITSYNQSNFTDYLLRGDFLSPVLGPYHNLIGISAFAGIIFFLAFGMLMIKTRSVALTSITMLFVIAVVGMVLPAGMLALVFVLIAGCIAILIISLVYNI